MPRTNHRTSIVILAVLYLILGCPAPTWGAGTNLWKLSGIETFLQGSFQGTGLTSQAEILPTLNTRKRDIAARLAWESIRVDGGILVGTSLPSTVQLIPDTGPPKKLLETRDLGFTAMARAGGDVFVAASPSGTLYRYDSERQKLIADTTLPDSFVWSMTADSSNSGVFIATGTSGRLYHMNREGTVRPLVRVPGNNILSLTLFQDTLYLGDDGGGLYRWTSSDGLESVFGFNQGEISALAADTEYLYVGVNQRRQPKHESQKESQISSLAQQLRQQTLQQNQYQRARPSLPRTDRPSTPPRVSPGARVPRQQETSSPAMIEAIREATQRQGPEIFAGLSGTLVYRMHPPEQMNVIYDDPQEIVHDLEAHDGRLYVATGGGGRLYKIRPDFTRIAYFESDHKLILDVLLEEGRPTTISTGEGASVYERIPFRQEYPRYRSTPLDSQLLSRWGTYEWFGKGDLEVRTRTGNTSPPDPSWNEWSRWYSGRRFSIPSPPARYLQFEVRFTEPESDLRRVEIAYRMPNQRPRITALQISPNPFRVWMDQSQQPGSEGARSRGNQSGPPGNGLPDHPLRQRQIKWNVMDPDGDPLRMRLFYRPSDGQRWIPFTDNFTNETSYNWDVSQYSDGWYLIKLVVTDVLQNTPGQGFRSERITGPFLIDNTAPEFVDVEVQKQNVKATIRDEASRILRAHYRINGGPWRLISPDDGIFDQSRENLTVPIPPNSSQGDLMELRTMDEGGNQSLHRLNLPGESS